MDSDDGYSDDGTYEMDSAPLDTHNTHAHGAFSVLDAEDLRDAHSNALQQVVSVWGVEPHQARALLMAYNWNLDLVQDAVVQDQDQVFRRCGAASCSTSTDNVAGVGHGTLTCGSCLEDDVPMAVCTTMSCGHTFCNDCWKTHFMVQIESGKSRLLRCMSFKCGMVCSDEKVMALLSAQHPDVAVKFRQRLEESFVDDNPAMKWCTSAPHCGHAISVKDPSVPVEPTCSCSQVFCFGCTRDAHSPSSCDMYKRWEQKCHDDSETVNWMNSNTKACPKCGKYVEKNSGCNHIVCLCGQAFCWLCGGATGRRHDWNSIEGHSCSRYKEQAELADKCQTELSRYLHYYKYWKAHLDSLEREGKRSEALRTRVREEEERGEELVDYEWVHFGFRQLVSARRVMACSHILAYYAFQKNGLFADDISAEQNTINQNLFEDKQAELERTIEALSKLLDVSLGATAPLLAEKKQEALSLVQLTGKRCGYLFEVVATDLLGQLGEALQKEHKSAAYVPPPRSSCVLLRSPPPPRELKAAAAAPSASGKRLPDDSPRSLWLNSVDEGARGGPHRQEKRT